MAKSRKAVGLNWQFAAGAAAVPAIIGVSSRVLARSAWAVPRYLTHGVAFLANGVAAFFVGGPFLWGSLLGQVPIAIDVVAGEIADMLAPTGAEGLPVGVSGRMGSAEPDAQGRAAGQVTEEDIAELQRLQQELQMSGRLGYRDREDTELRGRAMRGAPSRFR